MTSLAWSPAVQGALFTTGLAAAVSIGGAAADEASLGYLAGTMAVITALLLLVHSRNASRLEVVS